MYMHDKRKRKRKSEKRRKGKKKKKKNRCMRKRFFLVYLVTHDFYRYEKLL